MAYNIIIIITTCVQILSLVIIWKLIRFSRSKWAWVLIATGMAIMVVAQLIELYNLYFLNNAISLMNVYFIMNLVFALLMTVGIFKIGRLLRQIKKMDERRVESEKRFQLLFNNSGDEIFLADFDGNFIEVNQEALRRLGYTREELMNKNFSDIKTEKYIPLVKKNIEKILKYGQHIYETEHIAKDGTVIFLEMSSRVIDYFGSKAILSIARDITERKEIERRIATAIIETEERERKRFAADLHDDLGPLLSTIKLYTDLLKKGNFRNISHEEAVMSIDELVDKSIVAAREISNNIMPSILLDFGLNAAVKDFCDYIINTSSINLKLDTKQYTLQGRRIEETILFQSIKELVNNSLRHSQASNIEIFIENHDQQVNLFYKDDGIGFNVEEKLQQHTGMGLNNIVNKIKSINGLSIIKSKEGEGMSVLLSLHVR